MDKLIAIRIKNEDETYSENIPFYIDANNVNWDTNHNLIDILGEIDLSKGNIQTQLNEIKMVVDSPLSINQSISGLMGSFLDGANNTPIKSCIVNIETIQEGNEEPSLENIRSIKGRTGLKIIKTEKNLINDSIKIINVAQTTIHIGASAAQYPYFLQQGTYTLSCKFTDGVHYGALFKEIDGSQNTIWPTISTITTQNFEITKTGFYKFWFYRPSQDGGVNVDNVFDILLECASLATTVYSPYNGTVFPIDWETNVGTLYGGILDVTNGKLIKNMVCKQMTYQYLSGLKEGYIGITSNNLNIFDDRKGIWIRNWNYSEMKARTPNGIKSICNVFPVSINNSNLDSSQNRIYFGVPNTINSVQDFLNAVQLLEQNGNGLWIAYELGEPIEYQLNPLEIKTSLGINNIWSDSGNISIDYLADIKIYIDQKIKETIAALT